MHQLLYMHVLNAPVNFRDDAAHQWARLFIYMHAENHLYLCSCRVWKYKHERESPGHVERQIYKL